MKGRVYIVECELCRKEVARCQIKSMQGALGRHRTKEHPKHVGKISYKTTPVDDQLDRETQDLIAAHKADREWQAEQDRKFEEGERGSR